MTTIIDIVCLAAGYTLCWFTKDFILALVLGGEAFEQKLAAKLKALRAVL